MEGRMRIEKEIEIGRISERTRRCGRKRAGRGVLPKRREKLVGGEGVKAGGAKDGIGRSWVPDGVSEEKAALVSRWYFKGVSQTGTEAEALRV